MDHINFLSGGGFQRMQAQKIASCYGITNEIKKSEDTDLPKDPKKEKGEEDDEDEDEEKEEGSAPEQKQEKQPVEKKEEEQPKEEVQKSMSPHEFQAIQKSRMLSCYNTDESTLLKKSKGEGSRGGKVIGHTSSGKPIYGDGRPASQHNFTPEEHYEAKKAHQREASKWSKGSDMHNVHSLAASEHGDRAKHPLHAALDKFTSKYPDKPKGWGEGSGELSEIHSAMAEAHNDEAEITGNKKYTAHEGQSKTAQESHDRHKKGIKELAGKLSDRAKDAVHERWGHWFHGSTEQ